MEKKKKEPESSLFPRGKEMDISSEIFRLYRFPQGDTVLIKHPKTLFVDDEGVHRVIDMKDNVHVVPLGWIHIKYKHKEDEGAPELIMEREK